MIEKKELSKIRKNARAAGIRFERRVRLDLEKQGWIVDKWSNNIEFEEKYWDKELKNKINITNPVGKLVPAKPKFVFNPQIMRRIMIGNSSGFPDFITFRMESIDDFDNGKSQKNWRIMGVESKSNGILDKEEKEKCKWLLDNNIFPEILIASKGPKRGQIIYTDFSEKYQKV